jgi:HAD superfamily hydrolase (TIGR01484 family)
MAQFLLCTDLDGTVLGDPGGEAAFRAWAQRVRGRLTLAYVTGRGIDAVRALIAAERLPPADYAATAVGTEVWDLADPLNRLGRHYRDLADPAWPAERLRVLGHADDTPLQEAQGQGSFKASFYWNGQAAALDRFRERLSAERDWRLLVTADRYLDVLPHCFGKGQALRFLAAASGTGLKHSVAAGDMEHDLDMFEAAGASIAPANARPSVREALLENHGHVSDRNEAWGLLDGLHRLGLD